MTRASCLLLTAGVALALLAPLAAQTPQTPARDTRGAGAPAPIGTGGITGAVIVDDNSSRPVRYAYIVAVGTTTGTLRVTSSDAGGRFAIANLPADSYLVGASKAPFLGALAGAKRPERPGTPITVASGTTTGNVVIRLTPGAAIAGTITDTRGLPAAGSPVTVQRWRLQNGERALVPVSGGTTTTDERGLYRIYGLPPGDYAVVAMGTLPPARALADADVNAALKGANITVPPRDPSLRYAPVYFPGTVRVAEATTITLGIGEERSSVDFHLDLVKASGVSGTVFTAEGQPASGTMVMFSTATASSPLRTASATVVGPDGRFSLPTIGPGSYNVTAQTGRPTQQFATTQIEVAGMDITGLSLTMRPPLTLTGHIAFDGTTPAPSLAGRRVPLQPVANNQATPTVAPTTADGSFAITNVVPGRFMIGGSLFFGANTDSLIWALHSVTVDGHDATDVPFEINMEKPPKEIVVTYTDRWQELSGALQTSADAAASGYAIVLFPAEKAYWVQGSRRILVAQPDTNGRFRFGGQGPNTVPPGDYLLAAVTDIDRDEQFDPSFLASLIPSGTPIAIGSGERKTQDLAIR
jgi:hypothetical protein